MFTSLLKDRNIVQNWFPGGKDGKGAGKGGAAPKPRGIAAVQEGAGGPAPKAQAQPLVYATARVHAHVVVPQLS